MRDLFVKAFCFSLLFLFQSVSEASTVIALSLEERIAQSSWVVLGEVVDQQVHRDEEGLIVTVSEVVIENTLKGTKKIGESVFVHTLGGVVGQLGMHVPGEASLHVGERTVFFLSDFAKDGWVRPTGMAQGAVSVFEEDGESKVQFVEPRNVSTSSTFSNSAKPKTYSLVSFLVQIEKIHASHVLNSKAFNKTP